MSSTPRQALPLSQSAQASPHLSSQSPLTDIQTARERRRLQNRNAQRNHRLRKAAQKALHSRGQDSQQEGSPGYGCEPEAIWPSRVASVNALPTPPLSQHQAFPIHSVDVGLDDRINVDSLSLENVLFDIDGSDQADVDFLKGHASELFTEGTPGLSVRSSDDSRTPPSSLELQNFNPPRQKRSSGQLAIHIASKGGFASIIHVLLKNGADLNLADSRGRTALHYAVEGSHVDSIKVLLYWGADPLATDLSGLNSLHIAVSKGYYNVVCLLMDHGVDPNLGTLADDAESQVMRLIGTL